MSVSKEGNVLKVTCRFARGATALGCMLILESGSGTVSLERHLSLSNDTDCTTTQCSVHSIFDLSSLLIVGNISVIVFGSEESVLNNGHIREFRVEVSYLRTEIMNSTSSNSTIEIRLTTPGKCIKLHASYLILSSLKELTKAMFSISQETTQSTKK